MPLGEIDAIAKSFPHIRARDARAALRDLPELRAAGIGERRLDLFFDLVERLDGLPRHVAMHPCGVLLSDRTLLDRTPVEASFAGFPMSQFDKDDVEDLGLLKLDVLGIRMQSAMAHAVAEIRRVDGVELDLDDEQQVPFDDPATYALISSARTLGVFQIESPGQRELIGKSGIDDFGEIITDISLFRPGPGAERHDHPLPRRQARLAPAALPPRRPAPGPRADPRRRRLPRAGHRDDRDPHRLLARRGRREAPRARRRDGMAETRLWFFPRALGRGYPLAVVEQVWEVVAAFASFGFCKAHAAAFALPTYQSAWLKTHWPAHFLAGVLTHDPGMYPKRLILDDVRRLGIEVRGLDVDASEQTFVVERSTDGEARPRPSDPAYAIRLALSEVKGINAAEVDRIVAARPYASLTDFWHRARVSRPVVERLVLAGGFDRVYGIGAGAARRRCVRARPGDPPRPAAPGRRARPLRPRPRAAPSERPRAGVSRRPRGPPPRPSRRRRAAATAPTPARATGSPPSSGTPSAARASGRAPRPRAGPPRRRRR